MNLALWHLGDPIEWTWGRNKHRGTIVAFLEPSGVLASTDAEGMFGGGRVRVPWKDLRRSAGSAHRGTPTANGES